MFEGWEFQIPLYLLAVQRLLPEAGEPAGGGYYSLLNLDANNGIWDESLLKLLGMSSNISGKLSRKEIDALLAETTRRVGRLVSELRRGVFHLRPHECPDYCSFRDICRIDAHGKRVVTSVGEEAADETNGSTTTRH